MPPLAAFEPFCIGSTACKSEGFFVCTQIQIVQLQNQANLSRKGPICRIRLPSLRRSAWAACCSCRVVLIARFADHTVNFEASQNVSHSPGVQSTNKCPRLRPFSVCLSPHFDFEERTTIADAFVISMTSLNDTAFFCKCGAKLIWLHFSNPD